MFESSWMVNEHHGCSPSLQCPHCLQSVYNHHLRMPDGSYLTDEQILRNALVSKRQCVKCKKYCVLKGEHRKKVADYIAQLDKWAIDAARIQEQRDYEDQQAELRRKKLEADQEAAKAPQRAAQEAADRVREEKERQVRLQAIQYNQKLRKEVREFYKKYTNFLFKHFTPELLEIWIEKQLPESLQYDQMTRAYESFLTQMQGHIATELESIEAERRKPKPLNPDDV